MFAHASNYTTIPKQISLVTRKHLLVCFPTPACTRDLDTVFSFREDRERQRDPQIYII